MRNITKYGKIIELPFGKNLPGYELSVGKKTVIPSVLSNPFFHGLSIMNIQKKLKGFRNNKDLQKILTPVSVLTGISIHLEQNEVIQLVLDDELIKNNHLILVQSIISGNDIKVELINFGLKDFIIDENQIIATAIILKANI